MGDREGDKAESVLNSDPAPHVVHRSTAVPNPAVTAICKGQVYLNIRHSSTRYVVYGCVCACAHVAVYSGPSGECSQSV